MSFTDVIKKSILQGFSNSDIPTIQIVITLGVTFLIALYIFLIYRMIIKSALYDKSFHVSMAIVSVVTAGIIIAMQSSIVISLGMVGALSIVRFRTAIKNPIDLLFLFWSIGVGIICGAGLFEIAVVVSLMVTIGIFLLEFLPEYRKPYLLIINGSREMDEKAVIECIKKHARYVKAKSRNLKKNGADYIFEVHTKQEKQLLDELAAIDTIAQMSLLSHEGEVRI